MRITRFEDIEGWKSSRTLAQDLSGLTRKGAWSRDFFLASQVRRCALSGMANIAEGFDAGSNREFVRFLRIAYRSMSELQSHLYAALDEGYVDKRTFDRLYVQAKRTKSQVGGFIGYLKNCTRSSSSSRTAPS
jgi:four helix bundle protein